jgi:hypothetical protein
MTIMATDMRIRKNLNPDGIRSQNIRSKIIPIVSDTRVAIVIGMYMPLVG